MEALSRRNYNKKSDKKDLLVYKLMFYLNRTSFNNASP